MLRLVLYCRFCGATLDRIYAELTRPFEPTYKNWIIQAKSNWFLYVVKAFT